MNISEIQLTATILGSARACALALEEMLSSQRMPNSCALVDVIPAKIEQDFFAGLPLSLIRALKFFRNSLGWAAQ
jgi:hypothetical protein